jgi:hypothetical protein
MKKNMSPLMNKLRNHQHNVVMLFVRSLLAG